MKSLRIIFAGTPNFASEHMQAILDSHHDVIATYTQPDRPAGRGRKLKVSPVKSLALQYNIPCYQPDSLKTEESQILLDSLNADIMVVVAYGLILPQVVLDNPKLGCINVHASMLPRWRGAAPIQRAIEAGDISTGITIMQMDEGLDTGDMLIKSPCPIHSTDKASDLHDRLIETGKPILIKALDAIASGKTKPEKQDGSKACYAHKLSKKEAQLNWKKSANELTRLVNAFNPWPVAVITLDNQNIKVWHAKQAEYSSNEIPGTLIKADQEGLDITCGEGVLRITHVQPPSTRVMPVQDLLNSRKACFALGKQFS